VRGAITRRTLVDAESAGAPRSTVNSPMGMQYRLDPSRRLVHVRAWGVISTADLQDLTSHLLADPGFDGDFRSLTDLSAATGISVTGTELEATAWMPLYNAGARRAIVAPTDLMYGMGRVYAAHAEHVGETVRVFRSLQEAEAWREL
jgi:hypothetical protein